MIREGQSAFIYLNTKRDIQRSAIAVSLLYTIKS